MGNPGQRGGRNGTHGDGPSEGARGDLRREPGAWI